MVPCRVSCVLIFTTFDNVVVLDNNQSTVWNFCQSTCHLLTCHSPHALKCVFEFALTQWFSTALVFTIQHSVWCIYIFFSCYETSTCQWRFTVLETVNTLMWNLLIFSHKSYISTGSALMRVSPFFLGKFHINFLCRTSIKLQKGR